MTTLLDDHQFELLQTEVADTGVPFGIGRAIHCAADGFDPGVAEWLTQDVDNPATGTTMMGRDVRKGSNFTWTLFVNSDSEEDALTSLNTLATAWTGPGVSTVADEVAVIRYRVGGRTRRVYGRPRRWANTMDNRILSGMVPIVCDFQRVDPLFYDDVPEVATLDLVAESEGGIVYPVTYPTTSLPSGNNEGEVHIPGTRPSWPIIRITGEAIDPEIYTPTWTLKLNATIAEGDWVEIDTRPWRRSIINQDGFSVAGYVNPRVRMRNLFVLPGNQSFGFRALSGTMTGTATIKTYGAHAAL